MTVTWRPLTLSPANRNPTITPEQSGLVEQSIANYLQERDQASDKAFRTAHQSPSTSRIDVGHPEDPPENSQKAGWKVRNDGTWYNAEICDSDFEVDEEELGNEDDPSEEEVTKRATRQDPAK